MLTETEVSYLVSVVTDLARAGFSPEYEAAETSPQLVLAKDWDDTFTRLHKALVDPGKYILKGTFSEELERAEYFDPEGKRIEVVNGSHTLSVRCPNHAELVA